MAIEVLDDEITSVRDVWTGEEVPDSRRRVYRTVEGLFDLIEDAIRRDAYAISVTYNPDVGAPLDVYINYNRARQEEEIGYHLSDLGISRSSPP